MRKTLGIISFILGILSVLYCVGISFAGFGTYFFLIWVAIGMVLFAMAYLFWDPVLWHRIPIYVKAATGIIIGVGLLIFIIVEGMVLTHFSAIPDTGADYCIILGAQWKKNGPSTVLKYRLDEAVSYLQENPETKVIVSGGKGYNEPMAEADGMREYLLKAGVGANRIITENKSSNTYENLTFSAEFLDKEKDCVVIVTNNFHMFRALRIAEKQGYGNVQGLSAKSVVGFLPNNLLREFVGVMKDWLFGNL
ncbi:MAG: YdcF family protein [Lachnospiraceae bacterium]|nr:YdcF family protein [Lachnospiraceae bacterium]